MVPGGCGQRAVRTASRDWHIPEYIQDRGQIIVAHAEEVTGHLSGVHDESKLTVALTGK